MNGRPTRGARLDLGRAVVPCDVGRVGVFESGNPIDEGVAVDDVVDDFGRWADGYQRRLNGDLPLHARERTRGATLCGAALAGVFQHARELFVESKPVTVHGNADRGGGSRQNVVTGEGLIYFRQRSSRLRPYVLGGLGTVSASSRAGEEVVLSPERFSATRVNWRKAVGMDVRLKDWRRFRYSFWENVSANPLSRELVPPGRRNWATFQNMFGFVKDF